MPASRRAFGLREPVGVPDGEIWVQLVYGKQIDRLMPLGGPTVLLDIHGVRLLIDPTFDPPGSYRIGERTLEKTSGSAITPEELGHVDAVLLSHDQHPDNLDESGRALVARSPTLTTAQGAARLGATATALPTWDRTTVVGRSGRVVDVFGVPAQHGPPDTEHLTGPVTGFVIVGQGVPTIYVSGDNASLKVVQQIADRFPQIDVAVLFAGAASTPLVDGPLTLTSRDAVEAARILGSPLVLPVHTDGWAHFTEDHQVLEAAFSRADLSSLLLASRPGAVVDVDVA